MKRLLFWNVTLFAMNTLMLIFIMTYLALVLAQDPNPLPNVQCGVLHTPFSVTVVCHFPTDPNIWYLP